MRQAAITLSVLACVTGIAFAQYQSSDQQSSSDQGNRGWYQSDRDRQSQDWRSQQDQSWQNQGRSSQGTYGQGSPGYQGSGQGTYRSQGSYGQGSWGQRGNMGYRGGEYGSEYGGSSGNWRDQGAQDWRSSRDQYSQGRMMGSRDQWSQGGMMGGQEETVATVGQITNESAQAPRGAPQSNKFVEIRTRSGSSLLVDLGQSAENLNLSANQSIFIRGTLTNAAGQRVLIASEVGRVSQLTPIDRGSFSSRQQQSGRNQSQFGYMAPEQRSSQQQQGQSGMSGQSSQSGQSGQSQQYGQQNTTGQSQDQSGSSQNNPSNQSNQSSQNQSSQDTESNQSSDQNR